MRNLCLLLTVYCLLSTSSYAQDTPIPAKDAPSKMTVPDGFKVTLFAGEPDVVQPIGMCFDHRGRLWVAECLSYPKWLTDPKKGKDRITIFEDTDNDGRFDKRTVFHDKIANISGLQVGFGGVFVCAVPNLLFIPDKNGDDVPDGEPEILLDGWDGTARHNVFNSPSWGPDGWLYGCNGILSKSLVGPPGTPNAKRKALDCGVWRYHPVRKEFEVFARGTTNPWGIDWDEYGQMFITNCVIHHLWHIVPGGRYERMFGDDPNPHTYQLMKSCADYIHWGGGHWTSSRGGQGVHSDAGGGHAHSGCMIYLGDNWPAAYRGGVFTCNIHGNRINHDLLERHGSTYKARRCKDFLFANDPWFRGIALTYGPDGGVYVCDWCDTGECHNYEVAHTTTGRIYKITYGTAKNPAETLGKNWDLSKMSQDELLKLHEHRNEWFVRQSRRLLQECAGAKKLKEETIQKLYNFARELGNPSKSLRYVLSAIATDSFDPVRTLSLLTREEEEVMAWVIPYLLDRHSDVSKEIVTILTQQYRSTPVTRFSIATRLLVLPEAEKKAAILNLAKTEADARDPLLPLLAWYGTEELVSKDRDFAWKLIAQAKIPLTRELVSRRLAEAYQAPGEFQPWLASVARTNNAIIHRSLLAGLVNGFQGRRSIPIPDGWNEAYPVFVQSPLAEVRDHAIALAVQFGDKRALEMLRNTATDPKSAPQARQNAVQHLVNNQSKDLVVLLHNLLDDPALRAASIKGLASYDDPKTSGLILQRYAKLSDGEKADAVQTLASRPGFALALLDAIDKKQVPRGDVSAYTVRQMQALKNKAVNERVTQVWGATRPASGQKKELMSKYKSALTPEVLQQGNLSKGRLLYQKHCAACHKLFDEGASIGPDLTGAQRSSLDYLLENIIDPSAIVGREYQVQIFVTNNGRVVTGIVKQETDRAVTVQTQNEVIILPKDEIDGRQSSSQSMMPEGVLDQLTMDEARDLTAYLASPGPLDKGN